MNAEALGAHRLEGFWPQRRPAVMGIVNCTPDSFSDGGLLEGTEAAVRHAESLLDQGADLVDIGGESTRPGATAVSADEERRRVIPVITELRRRRPEIVISVDTTKATVAIDALAAGADVINDVSAGGDPEMLQVAAERGAAIVLMHMRGTPRTMQTDLAYDDVVGEVLAHLSDRAAAALNAGIDPDQIWLDPGIGFGKDDTDNLALLAALPRLVDLGHPVVVGPSRKSFIGRLTGAPVGQRLAGTLAALVPTIGLERSVLRVHEPAPVRQFLTIALGLRAAAS